MSCQHKRIGTTAIVLHPNTPNSLPRLVIRAQCVDCKMPFEFIGLPGDNNDFFHLSADRRELRVAITEQVKGKIN